MREASPAVLSVSAIAHLPLSGGAQGAESRSKGNRSRIRADQPGAGYTVACPNILRTLGISSATAGSSRTGRRRRAPSRSSTRRWLAATGRREDAIGKRFKIGGIGTDAPWLTVVGVFDNVRQFGLDSDPRPWFSEALQASRLAVHEHRRQDGRLRQPRSSRR